MFVTPTFRKRAANSVLILKIKSKLGNMESEKVTPQDLLFPTLVDSALPNDSWPSFINCYSNDHNM